jgi:N-formylglutamate amidohydrolase
MSVKETEKIFDLFPAQNKFIGIISIPHSGEFIPDEFKSYLIHDFNMLSRDVDTAVDKLVNIPELNQAGITVIKANIHRIAIDLNRPLENSMLNWKKNSHGEQVVIEEPDEKTKQELQLKYHMPYYEMLKALINELSKTLPKASFVDLHSMPGKATEYHLKINPNQEVTRPDFCLSDVNGETCEPLFIQEFKKNLSNYYNKVNINDPYFGGNVTREINRIFPQINNIQIEISRALYLNEKNRELIPDKVKILKENLTKMLIKSFQNVK